MWFFGLNGTILFSRIFNILYDIMSFSSKKKILKAQRSLELDSLYVLFHSCLSFR